MRNEKQKLQSELVVEIGRIIIDEIRPQEKITYRSYRDLYLKKPQDVLKQLRRTDERAGMGIAEITLVLTPHILIALQPVMAFLLDIAQESLKGAGADVLKETIMGVFHREVSEENCRLTFTSEQLAGIRTIIIAEGVKDNLPEDKAIHIANAIIGHLLPIAK